MIQTSILPLMCSLTWDFLVNQYGCAALRSRTEVSDNFKKAVRMQLTRCLYQMLTRSNSARLGFLCTDAFQNSDSSCLAHKLHPWRHHNLIPHTSDTNCKLTYLSHLPNNRFSLFPHWQKHGSNDNYVAMRGQTMPPIIGCLCKAYDGLNWYFIHPEWSCQYQMALQICFVCCKKMSSFTV